MSRPVQYVLRITRGGPSTAPFGWQIVRQQDAIENSTFNEDILHALDGGLGGLSTIAAPLALEGTLAHSDETPQGKD